MPTDPKDIPSIVSRLRENFNSEVTHTLEWRMKQLTTLKRMMEERKEEIARAVYDDLHRSRFESDMYEINPVMHEIQHAIDHVEDWMKPESKSTDIINMPGSSHVTRDPLGVVLIMAPWNYPVNLVFAPLVGALAAGNVVLIRPANYTPNVSSTIARIVGEYFEPNVISVVTGEREVTTAVLRERYDMIFFTGGATLGKVVYRAAAEHLTPVVLELGGKSPAIVDKSCDIDICAKRLVWSAFANAGQTCVRPDYVMVHETVADQLVKRMKEVIGEFYLRGNDLSEFALTEPFSRDSENSEKSEEGAEDAVKRSPYLARIINGGGAFDRLSAILEHDKQYIVQGGKTDAEQRFIAPTILDFGKDFDAFSGSKAMEAEIFGPIMPLVRVRSMDQAIQYVRAHEKPLALYCFTTDAATRAAVEQRTSSGGLVFNDCIVHLANYNLPFGGIGHSGMGAYHGEYSYRTFTHEKAVLRKFNFLDVPARYPPYTTGKQSLMKLVSQPISKRTTTVLTIGGIVVAIAGVAVLAKEVVLPVVLPPIIRFLQNVNAKL